MIVSFMPAVFLEPAESDGYPWSGPWNPRRLTGHADWNDCLNLDCFSTEPNESFQCAGDVKGSNAESVMIAGLFLYASREMAALYDFMGKGGDASRMRKSYDEMLDVEITSEVQASRAETQSWHARRFWSGLDPG